MCRDSYFVFRVSGLVFRGSCYRCVPAREAGLARLRQANRALALACGIWGARFYMELGVGRADWMWTARGEGRPDAAAALWT